MGRLKYLKLQLIILLITVANLIVNSDGFLMDLFSEKDRHGLSIRLDISDDECSNLPASWTNSAGSINTLGSCAQLYDEPFCKGSLTVIQPFHTIHQMDMSLINFQNRIQSASPCGPKIKTGRYVVQNAADATVLTVNSKYGGFARAHTTNATQVIPKNQQWEILDRGNSEYSMKPREFGDNYPVSYEEEALKKGQIKRKIWKLMSVGRGRYLIKNEPTQRCLYKTETNKIEEHDCRIWSPNQEWVFREIFGNPKPEKPNAAVGPGANFNILSKVAAYQPPTKPPPQYYPIFYNVSTLAKIRRQSTAAPYIIRKKIRRGPRPKTKPFELINQLRPPGLRPAISSKLASNNNYLLLRHPNNPNYNATKNTGEFVPSDDRLETLTYYRFVQQQALEAQKQAMIVQKFKEQQAIKLQKEREKEANRKKKKKKEEESDESKQDDEGDDDSDEDDDDKKKRPNKFNKNINKHHGPPNVTDDAASFFHNVYSKVTSGLGSSVTSLSGSLNLKLPSLPIPLPFLGKSGLKNETTEESQYSQKKPPPPYRRYKVHSNLYRRKPGPTVPTPIPWSKDPSKSTTTTDKPSSSRWSFFG